MDDLQLGDPGAVGGYRLLGRLGAGGMGQVFLGVSPGGRKVAVKLIHPVHSGTAQFRERFAREIEAARLVGGFHTAVVVDADPHADPPWMVTAYIDGPSLQEAVDRDGPPPPGRVRELGAGLAEGLAAIHACGLVHRDLKPGNVILAADGPRIIDFGIARTVDSTTGITATGTVVGTFAYMSPEQIRGDVAGPTSDVFALGGVLAFAATGRAPFGSDSAVSVMFRIVNQPPDLAGLADPGLRQLITACLAKTPQARPAVRAVLAALSGVAPAPADARPPRPAVPVADGTATATSRPAVTATGPGQQPFSPPSTVRPLRTRRSRRWPALLAAAAAAAVLAVVLPILLVSNGPGAAAGRHDHAASTSDPASAAGTNSLDAVSDLRATDHSANSAAGYNDAIRVDFTMPQANSEQLTTLEYGLNAASVSGIWTSSGPGSSVVESIGGLTNGTSYVVYVRGCNDAGRCGPWAGPSNRVTPYGPPREPSVTAKVSGTSIAYSWSGGGNGRPVSSYHVCFDGSCSNMAAGSITKSYGYGQTHTITVYAIDSEGQQSATASTSATTTAVPMTVSVREGNPGGNQIYVRCQPNNCHWAWLTITNAPPHTTINYACFDNSGQFWPTSGTGDVDWYGDVVKANGSGYVTFETECAWAYWTTAGHTLRVVVNGTTGTYSG